MLPSYIAMSSAGKHMTRRSGQQRGLFLPGIPAHASGRAPSQWSACCWVTTPASAAASRLGRNRAPKSASGPTRLAASWSLSMPIAFITITTGTSSLPHHGTDALKHDLSDHPWKQHSWSSLHYSRVPVGSQTVAQRTPCLSGDSTAVSMRHAGWRRSHVARYTGTHTKALCLTKNRPCLTVRLVLLLRSWVVLVTVAVSAPLESVSIRMRFFDSCSWHRMTFSVPCKAQQTLLVMGDHHSRPVNVHNALVKHSPVRSVAYPHDEVATRIKRTLPCGKTRQQ